MRKRGWPGVLIGGAVAAVLGASLRRSYARYTIADHSMEPALHPGDYLVVRRRRGLRRGDIVIFPHPERPDFELVKRVVGLPGERLEIAGGQVHIDGRVLAEPWADGPTFPDGEWDLGPDDVFVIGDRRRDSTSDGRTLGPVPMYRLRWVAAGRYWPPGRIGRVA